MEEQSRNSTYSLIGSLGGGVALEDETLCTSLSGDDYLLYSCIKLYRQLNKQNGEKGERFLFIISSSTL